MDGGEYISSMENMDPTLAELGDEFTLGDIDGESLVFSITSLFLVKEWIAAWVLYFRVSVDVVNDVSACTPLLLRGVRFWFTNITYLSVVF